MKNIIKIKFLALLFTGFILLNSCEDTPPTDYVQSKYLEGYLIVDEPVHGIKLMNSQPVNVKFDAENAMIKDADVKLVFEGVTHSLLYRSGEDAGYYLQDENVKVKPETKYEIIIMTKDGLLITSETTTPKRITEWITPPKENIFYPQDTLKLPKVDSLEIAWTATSNDSLYLIRTLCKDTSDYGKYLNPPVSESNRRTYNIISSQDEDQGTFYQNKTNWSLIGSNHTPTVWLAFKWFGPHEVTVYNPDDNMKRWFVNVFFTGSTENYPLLNSVKGGNGVFGSASVIRKDIFLFKNQK